jgi:hypothetical protein
MIPALKTEMFAKTLGMGYPNAYLWRLCPNPKASAFVKQITESAPIAWTGSLRLHEDFFRVKRSSGSVSGLAP